MKTILISSTLAFVLNSCQTTTPTPVSPASTPIIKITPKPKMESKLEPPIAKKTPPKIKPYPLEKCLVTDEPLDEWDDMQTIVYKGQEMKFCCEMCLKKFNKNPVRYLSLLP
jgi:hypothetical protein